MRGIERTEGDAVRHFVGGVAFCALVAAEARGGTDWDWQITELYELSDARRV